MKHCIKCASALLKSSSSNNLTSIRNHNKLPVILFVCVGSPRCHEGDVQWLDSALFVSRADAYLKLAVEDDISQKMWSLLLRPGRLRQVDLIFYILGHCSGRKNKVKLCGEELCLLKRIVLVLPWVSLPPD